MFKVLNTPRLCQVLLLIHTTLAAFTQPTSYNENTVQTNAAGTWCYYPQSGQTTSTTCGANFDVILGVHLNTTVSIGYYAPDNTRYGGAQWAVPVTNPGIVTLCVSGRAQDETYQTACAYVTADNSLPLYGSACLAVVAQKTVTDGCYVPMQLAASPSPSPTSSTSTTSTSTTSTTSTSTSSTSTNLPNSSQVPSSTYSTPPSATNPSSSSSSPSQLEKILLATIIPVVIIVVGIIVIYWLKRSRPPSPTVLPGMEFFRNARVEIPHGIINLVGGDQYNTQSGR